MSKYVIELDEDVKILQSISVTPQGNAYTNTQWIVNLEELNSDYINEHFSDLQDTAYQKGLEDGKQTAVGAAELREKLEYQRGLNEAWDCAKRISLHPDNGGMTCAEISAAFGEASATNVLYKCSAQQAIEKLKAYEEKQKADDEIKVGDTVNLKDGGRDNDGIVTKSWDNDRHFIMWADGSGGVWDKEYIVKTGRHFDIEKILEAMKA